MINMTCKKAPSIKQQNKKHQLIAERKAHQEYWDKIYAGYPQLKEAMEKFVKQEINKNNDR